MEWITDRPPTEADGDNVGCVVVLLDMGKGWYALRWSEVEPGRPWLPFIPPALARTLLMNEEAAEKISVKEAKKEKARLEHEISALMSAFSEKTGLRIEDVSLMPLVSMGEKARYCVNIATNL